MSTPGVSFESGRLPDWGNAERGRSRPDDIVGKPRRSFFLLTRTPARQRITFSRSLAVLLQAHVPLSEAISLASAPLSSQAFKAVLDQTKIDVDHGRSFSDALSKHPATFDSFYTHLVKVGESTGTLGVLLGRIADHLEKSAALKRKIGTALAYPATVLIISFAAVIFMLTVIIPAFSGMYDSFDKQLPLVTVWVMDLSSAARTKGWVVFPMAALLVYGLKRRGQIPEIRLKRELLLRRLPVLGTLLTESLMAGFCRTLGTLLHHNVQLLPALDLIAASGGSLLLEVEVRSMEERITSGKKLLGATNRFSPFPPLVRHMLFVGEESAQLDLMLMHLADHYERRVDESVGALMSVIEPLMMVVLGAIVGFILVSLYLPIFKMVEAIG